MMTICISSRILLFSAVGLMAGCAERPSDAPPQPIKAGGSCEGVSDVVEQLGERMKEVSLLAPDSSVAREIREAYAGLVTADLLNAWLAEPAHAPGREVSSPWPQRMEVRSVQPEGVQSCRVEADVIYVTSTEAPGEPSHTMPVELRVERDGEWRVSSYEVEAPSPTTPVKEEPADVLRKYYAAINARDFRTAYELWGSGGAASGQTLEAFAAGFEETASVELEIGQPGRVEPAAGSQYVGFPVVISATLKDGEKQRFEGTYTLRRSLVEGATPEQRGWHIYDASIAPLG